MKFKDFLYSISVNSLQVAAVIAATIYGSVGATRLVVFGSVVSAFIALIACAFAKPALESAYAKGKEQNKTLTKYTSVLHPVKKFLSRTTDIASVILLVYSGFWFSAVALFMAFMLFESFMSHVQDFVDEKKGLAA